MLNYLNKALTIQYLLKISSSFLLITNDFSIFFSDKVIQILGQKQKGVIARSMLLRPGGPLASELAQHAVVLKVNDWVFCHGGLLPHHGKSSTAI
jgi:hypothetical protein